MDIISDLVEGPLPELPYTQLKARLLAAHQLSNYQKVEKLSQIPPLGAQKPSELLAAMLKLCPRGQSVSSRFFSCIVYPASSGCCCRTKTTRTGGLWRSKRTGSGPTTRSTLMMWWPP